MTDERRQGEHPRTDAVTGAEERGRERPEAGVRPADVVRRALRAAREATGSAADEEDQEAARDRAREREPGPGDAARAALRRAKAEGTSGEPGNDRGDGRVAAAAVEGRAGTTPGETGVPTAGVSGEAGVPTAGVSGEAGVPTAGVSGEAGVPAAGAADEIGVPAAGASGETGTADPGGRDHPAGSTAAPAPEPASAAQVPPSSPSAPAASAASAPAPSPAHRAAGQPRAADIAREALRAARAQARRSASEEARREGGRRRGGAGRGAGADKDAVGRRSDTRAPGAGERAHRTAEGAHGAGQRARELRAMLSGAFRMPADESPPLPHDAPPDTSGEPTGPPAATPSAADIHPGPDAGGDARARAGGPSDARTPAAAEEPARTRAADAADAAGQPGRDETAPSVGAAARAPRSMAAPSRDGDLRRTFPASRQRTGTGTADGEGAAFAETWWGNAWVTALEEGALDVKRLLRGRGYAEGGQVDAITVTPGLVLAYVRGSRPRPYRVQVRLRTLDDADWDRFLDAAVDRPDRIAALLDKEMPESLADCGVPLLPGPGDLDPHCSCPDRGHPCKHAAALCYQTARLLDADPFVLLLLRGRGERDLLDALSRRNATRAACAARDREPEPLPGVRATDALAERRLPPLPAPLPPPAHPEQPPAYPSAPDGPDSFALDQLATDAAARAHALLTTGRDEIGELTLWQDAVRTAAARPGSGLTAASRALYSALASATGRTPTDLARAVAAWRQGGPDGLAALEDPWDPPAGRFDRARPLLLAADLPAFRPWRNRLTHPAGDVQLRLGRDGLWYAYESEPDRDDWWPRGTPDPDPVGALTGLGGSGGL
ncbi:SWIM zinc finger family protein [Streptomyces sp. bgisy153]|uniref:SWIM zinc finger family protein n=1 Tax=Streptomyces sp. bgisy153 TaxID=3413793 RepID=UPI003D72D8B6